MVPVEAIAPLVNVPVIGGRVSESKNYKPEEHISLCELIKSIEESFEAPLASKIWKDVTEVHSIAGYARTRDFAFPLY